MSSVKTGYQILDVMTTQPIKITKENTVQSAAQVMKEKGVGSLLVTEKAKLVGILTEKDIVVKLTVPGYHPSDVTVNQIMTKDVITIEPGRDLYDAIVLMKNSDVRRLPVMDEDNLMGIITLKDVLKIEPALFELVQENINIREFDRKNGLLD